MAGAWSTNSHCSSIDQAALLDGIDGALQRGEDPIRLGQPEAVPVRRGPLADRFDSRGGHQRAIKSVGGGHQVGPGDRQVEVAGLELGVPDAVVAGSKADLQTDGTQAARGDLGGGDPVGEAGLHLQGEGKHLSVGTAPPAVRSPAEAGLVEQPLGAGRIVDHPVAGRRPPRDRGSARRRRTARFRRPVGCSRAWRSRRSVCDRWPCSAPCAPARRPAEGGGCWRR